MRNSHLHGKSIRRDLANAMKSMREGDGHASVVPTRDTSAIDGLHRGQSVPEAAEVVQNHERFLRRLLDRNEELARSIASAIHDDLVQLLTAAMSYLEAAQAKQVGVPHDGQEYLRTGLKLLRDGIGESRRLATRLQPLIDHAGSVELEQSPNAILQSTATTLRCDG